MYTRGPTASIRKLPPLDRPWGMKVIDCGRRLDEGAMWSKGES
jgi:hypothetical protein